MSRKLELTGKKFERLTAISEAGRDNQGRVTWNCHCECGNNKVIASRHLVQGKIKSCGCYAIQNVTERMTTHDLTNKNRNLLNIWYSMKRRCLNKKDIHYPRWGGRGITVCDEWMDPITFFEWAINNGYKTGLSIDRIDNNGNYEPNNCRWVTVSENSKKMNIERGSY
ncbi:hypothetical protein [Marinilactibacillus psychrotolerans]|uniref:AP2 domain-containing protein n=1 Tax=Marinilactibacillus psychrotolerans TaxID=191770 RepID=A0AAV3WRL2_9LACT|nr:hypothetical protein [Marinilactibacillus psychrotolerans]GEL67233.1 hypothetical protein MPS01_13880 [Marinilactibacillus psychrotolerans]GEQ36037.1 hypothetical protein M132T_15450 [Marinilactibacillus psychrotolerans]SDC60843.1 hypothetical protein SAMN04488013_10749 [Marinilactibacillus psychrotolerans]